MCNNNNNNNNNNNQTATSKVNCPANRGIFLLGTRRLEQDF